MQWNGPEDLKVLLSEARYRFVTQGIALWCKVLLCDVKQGMALWSKVLLCDARYCFVVQGFALWYKILLCDAMYCFVMQGIALWHKVWLCDTRYGFVTHGIALWRKVLLYKVCVLQGAIEGCRNGFLLFCTSLMSCDDASLSAIPTSILNQVIFAKGVFVLVFSLSVMFLLVSAQWSEDSRCASCSKVTLNRVCTLTNVCAWFPFCSAITDVFVGMCMYVHACVCVCVHACVCVCAHVCTCMGVCSLYTYNVSGHCCGYFVVGEECWYVVMLWFLNAV